MHRRSFISAACVTAFLAPAWTVRAQQPAQPTPQERIANLKAWLQASQNQIRAYEWIETTVISQGGAEKSRIQKRCYFGANGQLQKVQISQTQAEGGKPPGILPMGKVANKMGEKKKGEATDYMKNAAELVHSYIPPNPSLIQRSADTGKVSVVMAQPGRLVRVNIGDYLKPGDMLSADIELPTNRLVAVNVATYLDAPSDAITLAVGMGVLPDGTLFPAQNILDAKAKSIRVTVQNAGHRRTAG